MDILFCVWVQMFRSGLKKVKVRKLWEKMLYPNKLTSGRGEMLCLIFHFISTSFLSWRKKRQTISFTLSITCVPVAKTHHSSVCAVFVRAPDSVLARVRPVHAICGRVKIQGHDVASVPNQRAHHVGLGCDVILHDLIPAGHQQERLPGICAHRVKKMKNLKHPSQN